MGEGFAMTTYTISGTILAAGVGLAGVTVSDGTRSAVTATDGTYTITAVPNGTYTLTPTKSKVGFYHPTLAAVVSGANLTGKDFVGYTEYMIGTTLNGMTPLRLLTTLVPEPKSTYHPWSKPIQLGNGAIRGMGWKITTWYWEIIQPAQVEQLRAFCPGASAEVYIASRQNIGDAFKPYKAVMIWPEEDRDFLRRVKIEIKFQRLEDQV
jgi:hypothetical protein